jgi:hypothetical protein
MRFDGLRTMYDVCESDNVIAWNANQYAFAIVNPICPPLVWTTCSHSFTYIMPIVCFTVFPMSKLGQIWKALH